MKKKRIIKRLLSMLLVIAMTTAMLPQTLQASQNVSEASEITANEAEADDTGDTGTEADESNASDEEAVDPEAVDTKLENPIAVTSEEDGSGTGDSAYSDSEAADTVAVGSVTSGNDTTGSNLISGGVPEQEEELCIHGNDPTDCPVCDLEGLIDELPTLAEATAMNGDEEEELYDQVSALADIYYDELTEEQQAQVSNIDALWEILDYFSSGMVLTATTSGTVSYIDATGSSTSYTGSYTSVESSTTSWSTGWYVANTTVTISGRITVSGTVNLILVDGVTFTASKGITVEEGNTLNIYGQTDSTGKLTVDNCEAGYAAIGTISHTSSSGYTSGTITINGGTVTATGPTEGSGAGIGGGQGSGGSNITINGGTVTATGGGNAAGIGGGSYGTGSNITINGGTVTATGGYNRSGGAGIGGGGYGGNASNITINGGTVTAKGGYEAAGIGGGQDSNYEQDLYGNGSNITINGGTVTATGGDYGAGIGGGRYGNGSDITIKGGTVTATGGSGGAGIGGGFAYNSASKIAGGIGSNITVSGGYVKATANWAAASTGNAIGKGGSGSESNITITGGYFGNGTAGDSGTGKAYNCGVSSGYSVYSNIDTTTKSSYPYVVMETGKTFTVKWMGEDGTTLLESSSGIAYDQITSQTYDPNLTKESTDEYEYVFSWSGPVVSLTDSIAVYTASFVQTKRSYTVTWKNSDTGGTTLLTSTVEYGSMPSYSGNTPTKAASGDEFYTFAGWDETITAVTADATYIAQYATSTISVQSGDSGYTSGSWTTDNVVFTITGDPAITKYQYSTDNGSSWTDLTASSGNATLTLSDSTNGTTYIFRGVTASGTGTGSASYVVNIDKTHPVISVSGETTAYLQRDTVTIGASDAHSGIKSVTVSKDGGEAEDITANYGSGYSVTVNGTYTFTVTDNVGFESSTSIIYNNIDTGKPVVNINSNGYTEGVWTNQDITLTITNTGTNRGTTKFEYSADNGSTWKVIEESDDAYTVIISANTPSDGTVYMFRATSESGVASDTRSITVKVDKTSPVGTITVKENQFTSFLNTITFGYFFNETQTVSVTISDVGSGMTGTWYYLSDTALSEEEVKALNDEKWKEYTGSFSIDPDRQLVIYVKAMDNSGNTAYISSDGLVLDATDPVFVGLTDNAVYCTDVTFTVTEAYMDSVTVDGQELAANQDGSYTITADNQTHTVTARDKAGNSVSVSLTMNTGHIWEYSTNGTTIAETCKHCSATASVTISAPTGDQVYDGSTHNAALSYSGTLSGTSPSITYTLDSNSVTDTNQAGEYTASITYGGKTASVTYTVSKAAVTITAADTSKTYGDMDPALTGTVTGVLDGDDLNVTYSREAGEGAGTYQINAAYDTGNNNYRVTVDTAVFTINKKAVTVTADNKTSVYGSDIEALTFTIPEGSLVGSDTADDLAVTLTKASGNNVGDYAITGASESLNYDVTVTSGTYTITQASLKVTANDKTITYGDAPANNGVSYSGFVNGDSASDLGGTLVYNYSYTQYGNVGTYSIIPSGLSSGNYAITYEDGGLTVGQRTVELGWTILGEDDLVYDGNAKTLSATVANKAQDVDDVSVTVALTGHNVDVTEEGFYYTATSLTGDNSGNYKLPENTRSKTYKITGADITITVANSSKTYGEVDPELTGTINGTISEDDLENLAVTYSRENGEDAGKYKITASYTENGNYIISVVDGTLTINKKAVTVTIESMTKNYGDNNPSFAFAITEGKLVDGDTEDDLAITLTTTAAKSSAAGTYVITGTSESINYDVTILDGTLKIVELIELPEQDFPDDGAIHKVEIQEGLTEVPDALKNNPNLNTVEKIEAMLKTVVSEQSGYSEENSAVYEVTLMVSLDGGVTWEKATEENFPENGLTVILPYPDGTGKDSHDFVVTHMFTSTAFGKTPGDTETPDVIKTDDGLQVTVTGLSPIAIAWKEVAAETTNSTDTVSSTSASVATEAASEATASGGADTGDSSWAGFWLLLMAASGTGIIWIAGKRRKKHNAAK